MAEGGISEFISNGMLRVFAKPGKKKSKIIGFDAARKALVVEVGAPAEGNKANMELVKFISKRLGKPVLLKSGFTGKEKVLLVKK